MKAREKWDFFMPNCKDHEVKKLINYSENAK